MIFRCEQTHVINLVVLFYYVFFMFPLILFVTELFYFSVDNHLIFQGSSFE